MCRLENSISAKNASEENIGLCNSFEKLNKKTKLCVKSKYVMNWSSWNTEINIQVVFVEMWVLSQTTM